MSFIRPAARARLWRWREAVAGLVLGLLGIWLAVAGIGFVRILGTCVVIAGAVLVFAGLQRARFRIGSGGPGVVQIDEAQVTYYGPLNGGVISLGAVTLIELVGAGVAQHWRLTEPGAPPLSIPTKAEGADLLFDAFATLKGLDVPRMLNALADNAEHPVVIWRKEPARLH
ncbi:hypothetical protein [Pseudogemmobacter sp. W21_MBD1_M6]|uniref:hypothetical protein n=1 Tax=Pseudogemmobacter sp. W21_MBD1_M6 TaxID=3240271 RepID=UPI003F958601